MREKIMQSIGKAIRSVEPDARIVLFGSRARGDYHAESDWDVLILVNRDKVRYEDVDRIYDPLIDIGLETGEYISPKIFTFQDWARRSFTPFYKNVEQDGIEL